MAYNVPFRSIEGNSTDVWKSQELPRWVLLHPSNDQGFIQPECCCGPFSLRKERTISVVLCYVEYVNIVHELSINLRIMNLFNILSIRCKFVVYEVCVMPKYGTEISTHIQSRATSPKVIYLLAIIGSLENSPTFRHC